jgi:hypothetical protein
VPLQRIRKSTISVAHERRQAAENVGHDLVQMRGHHLTRVQKDLELLRVDRGDVPIELLDGLIRVGAHQKEALRRTPRHEYRAPRTNASRSCHGRDHA